MNKQTRVYNVPIFASLGLALLTTSAYAQSAHAQKAAPPVPAAAAPAPLTAPAADTPAVAAVRKFLNARAAGNSDAVDTLLSAGTRAQLSALQAEGQGDKLIKAMTTPAGLASIPPGALPVLALFADRHDVLRFRFRALGPDATDPAVVLVRTYQVGTPLSTVSVLKVVTVPGPAGSPLLDAEKTAELVSPQITRMRSTAQQTASQSNLKQLSLGILQYTQDHDETLPDAEHWMDEILPYVKTESLFHDPSSPEDQPYGYAFNKALSKAKVAQLDAPAATVLLFESTLGVRNAADTGQSVPRPGHYSGGTDYAFTDGHVKWQKDGAALSYSLNGK